MIQRKQTLYLLIAILLLVFCLCNKIVSISTAAIGQDAVLYNIALVDMNGVYSFKYIPLFIILAVAIIVMLVTIFSYKKRKLQIKLCYTSIILLFAWILTASLYYADLSETGELHGFSVTAVFPVIAIILNVMASSAVKADEMLVRAADRIR